MSLHSPRSDVAPAYSSKRNSYTPLCRLFPSVLKFLRDSLPMLLQHCWLTFRLALFDVLDSLALRIPGYGKHCFVWGLCGSHALCQGVPCWHVLVGGWPTPAELWFAFQEPQIFPVQDGGLFVATILLPKPRRRGPSANINPKPRAEEQSRQLLVNPLHCPQVSINHHSTRHVGIRSWLKYKKNVLRLPKELTAYKVVPPSYKLSSE